VRLVRLALVLGVVLPACDGSTTQAPPPLGPPPGASSQGGAACSQTTVDGATVSRFASDGACIPGDVMVLYRCSATVDPVLRLSSVAGPALFLGGAFAVPVDALPANVRIAGESDGTEVLIADPPSPSSLPAPSSESSSLGESSEPGPPTEPLVYVRHDGVTERWLRLEGGGSVHDPPTVWLIGDSILDGGRDAVEAGLSGWSVTLDAEVGRPASSGVPLATDAAEQSADVVVMELGTNDSSTGDFRDDLIETLDVLSGVPLVVWQTAKGPGDETSIPVVNEAIRAIVPTYPNAVLADWEAFAPEEALQVDGIHPDEGFERLEAELLLPMLSEWRAAISTEGATSCGRKIVRDSS
jgi:hypothetical protein